MDEVNGRVTNAVIKRDIEALTETVKESTRETRQYRLQAESRLRDLEQYRARSESQIYSLQKEDETLCSDIDKLKDRTNLWGGLNTGLALVGSMIAAIFGANK